MTLQAESPPEHNQVILQSMVTDRLFCVGQEPENGIMDVRSQSMGGMGWTGRTRNERKHEREKRLEERIRTEQTRRSKKHEQRDPVEGGHYSGQRWEGYTPVNTARTPNFTSSKTTGLGRDERDGTVDIAVYASEPESLIDRLAIDASNERRSLRLELGRDGGA